MNGSRVRSTATAPFWARRPSSVMTVVYARSEPRAASSVRTSDTEPLPSCHNVLRTLNSAGVRSEERDMGGYDSVRIATTVVVSAARGNCPHRTRHVRDRIPAARKLAVRNDEAGHGRALRVTRRPHLVGTRGEERAE